MKTNLRLPFLLISVLLLSIVASGCSSYKIINNNGSKTLVMNKGIGKFSFDFNPKYERYGILETTNSYTDFSLKGPKVDEAGRSTIISFAVLKSPYSSYQSALDNTLSLYEKSRDFKLLERFPITIAGEKGEQAVYYYLETLTNEALIKGIKPVHVITRRAEFFHDNLAWSLDMGSLESTADADKVDFEQIIRTFNILN